MTKMNEQNKIYKQKMIQFETDIIVAKNGTSPVKDLLRVSRHMNDFFEEFKNKYVLTKEQRREYKKNRMVAKTFGKLIKHQKKLVNL